MPSDILRYPSWVLYFSTTYGTSRRSPSWIGIQGFCRRLVVDHGLGHPVWPTVQPCPEPSTFWSPRLPDVFQVFEDERRTGVFSDQVGRQFLDGVMYSASLSSARLLEFLGALSRILDVELDAPPST